MVLIGKPIKTYRKKLNSPHLLSVYYVHNIMVSTLYTKYRLKKDK